MRVLVAYNDYLQAGGERFSVATEVAALRAHGAQVEVFQVDNASLAEGGLAGRVRGVLGDPGVARALDAAIARFRPDICHAENLFPRLGASAIEVLRERRLPWVRTFRNYRVACVDGSRTRDGRPCTACTSLRTRAPGIVHRCYHGSVTASLGATMQVSRDARSMRGHAPGAHVFISDFLRRALEPTLPERVPGHVVPNAVDLAAADAREWAGRRWDALFIGRLSQEKGLPLVMSAARALPRRTFAIVGSGPLAAEVEREAAALGNLTVVGHVGHGEVATMLGEARVVMVPSQWEEPFGRVSIEAQRLGAIPLVSALGGLPETLPGAFRDALTVAQGTAEAWTASLDGVLGWGGSRVEEFQAAAHAAWESDFSPRALAERLTRIYESAL